MMAVMVAMVIQMVRVMMDDNVDHDEDDEDYVDHDEDDVIKCHKIRGFQALSQKMLFLGDNLQRLK